MSATQQEIQAELAKISKKQEEIKQFQQQIAQLQQEMAKSQQELQASQQTLEDLNKKLAQEAQEKAAADQEAVLKAKQATAYTPNFSQTSQSKTAGEQAKAGGEKEKTDMVVNPINPISNPKICAKIMEQIDNGVLKLEAVSLLDDLTKEGFAELLNMLKENNSPITQLYITCQSFNNFSKGDLAKLATILKENKTLTSFTLRIYALYGDYPFSSEDVKAMAEMVSSNTTLKSLTLPFGFRRSQEVPDEVLNACKDFLKPMESNRTLIYLDIGKPYRSDKEGQQRLELIDSYVIRNRDLNEKVSPNVKK